MSQGKRQTIVSGLGFRIKGAFRSVGLRYSTGIETLTVARGFRVTFNALDIQGPFSNKTRRKCSQQVFFRDVMECMQKLMHWHAQKGWNVLESS